MVCAIRQRAFAALEGKFEAELVGELNMKGFARPVRVYEIRRVADS